MQARLEERRRVMFPKSSVFTVVALAIFVSFGPLLFPQVGQAQECLWNCDAGSDPLNNPGDNSPGYSIIYCFDRPCVENLKDSNGNFIFTGDIPTALVQQTVNPNTCPSPLTNISISGTVVAVLRDNHGIILPQSAAEATFFVQVKKANCDPDSTLSRVVQVNEPRTDVFDANSSITILKTPSVNVGNSSLTAIGWGGPGCPTNPDGTLLFNSCSFPFGIVEFNNINTLSNELPDTGASPTDFLQGEVYRGVASVHFIGVRMCKGDANSTDPSTIACSVGGFVANAVWEFPGDWVSNFNPGSNNSQFDIISPEHFRDIDRTTVAATLVDTNGIPTTPEVEASRCFLRASNNALRCNFDAREFGLTQCPSPPSVHVVLRGEFSLNGTPQKFKSEDIATCSSK